jgi:uncharacterized protein
MMCWPLWLHGVSNPKPGGTSMKIGLLSDTHGYLDDKVFKYFDECDEVWHAGDIGSPAIVEQLEAFKPFKAVWGNIDGQDIRVLCPEHQRLDIEGCKVWMTHIGGYPGHYSPAVRKALKEGPVPNVFICGHSHILRVIPDPAYGNMLTINPGAAGVHGFHKVRTLLRFEIKEGRVVKMEAIELGLRARPK